MKIYEQTVPSLDQVHIKTGMRVMVRADTDVVIVDGKVPDASRIQAMIPTLRMLGHAGARIRIIGHLGRPQDRGKQRLSLAPVGRLLATLLRREVILIEDPFCEETRQRYGDTADMLLFENIRFWPGEEKNSLAFAKSLARWGDIYINEAFANCHRAHASMVGLPRLLPAYAGLHLAEEMSVLKRIMENPARPFVVVFGGAKVETKIPLIKRFLHEADHVLVGGVLANTLFVSAGKSIGRSLAEKAIANDAAPLIRNKKLVLPIDVLAASGLQANASYQVHVPDEVRADEYIVDIGVATVKLYSAVIGRAKTIIWNGPVGFAEIPAFAKGTIAVARAMHKSKGFTVVGGGDTLAALVRYRLMRGFSHISTGGGAMLEFLSGVTLPAIKALENSTAARPYA